MYQSSRSVPWPVPSQLSVRTSVHLLWHVASRPEPKRESVCGCFSSTVTLPTVGTSYCNRLKEEKKSPPRPRERSPERRSVYREDATVGAYAHCLQDGALKLGRPSLSVSQTEGVKRGVVSELELSTENQRSDAPPVRAAGVGATPWVMGDPSRISLQAWQPTVPATSCIQSP